MTVASSMHRQRLQARSMQHHVAQPTGVSWLALHLGLALVAWGRRSANRPELSWEEQHILHEANRMRAALLEERGLVPTPR
jgi:hypothetical protein